jgi:hypothetical protein
MCDQQLMQDLDMFNLKLGPLRGLKDAGYLMQLQVY